MMDGRPVQRQWFKRASQSNWERHVQPRGPFASYLEIGTYCGDSLLWFAEHCAAPGAILTAVDPWGTEGTGYEGPRARIQSAEQVTRSRIAAFLASSWKNLTFDIRRQTSREFFDAGSVSPGSINVAFVDGVHYAEPALFDMCSAWATLRRDGILIVDDIHMRSGANGRRVPHTGDAFDEFVSARRGEFAWLYRTRRQAAILKTPMA